MTYAEFKHLFLQCFNERNDIDGLGIVGSYARGTAAPASDVDAVIFCQDPSKYMNDQSWLGLFGEAREVKFESWGIVQTTRVFFHSGLEAEFNFSTIAWADIPVDPGTSQVVSDGFEILYDPTGKLERLKREVGIEGELGTS